jgi:Spy/CpxP family protein refolding chaperone
MMKTATTILVAAAAALIALVGTTAVSAMQVPAHPHLVFGGSGPARENRPRSGRIGRHRS